MGCEIQARITCDADGCGEFKCFIVTKAGGFVDVVASAESDGWCWRENPRRLLCPEHAVSELAPLNADEERRYGWDAPHVEFLLGMILQGKRSW